MSSACRSGLHTAAERDDWLTMSSPPSSSSRLAAYDISDRVQRVMSCRMQARTDWRQQNAKAVVGSDQASSWQAAHRSSMCRIDCRKHTQHACLQELGCAGKPLGALPYTWAVPSHVWFVDMPNTDYLHQEPLLLHCVADSQQQEPTNRPAWGSPTAQGSHGGQEDASDDAEWFLGFR